MKCVVEAVLQLFEFIDGSICQVSLSAPVL